MNKDKLFENPFNIIKNQEFGFFKLHHLAKLISPKPMEQLVESNSIEQFKRIASTTHTFPIFHIFVFFKKRFLRKSSKLGHCGLVLIIQAE